MGENPLELKWMALTAGPHVWIKSLDLQISMRNLDVII